MSKKFRFTKERYTIQERPVAAEQPFEKEVEMVKSTYLLPSDRHEALRVLKAREGRKLNDLLLEAVDDLLYKYSRK